METVLIGWRRRAFRVPWRLFQMGLVREARRSRRTLGHQSEDERRVHHFIVREMPGFARPMPPEHIASGVGLPVDRVRSILGELERRMIYLYREGGRNVVWAYPVTAATTPHHLAFSSGERIDAA